MEMDIKKAQTTLDWALAEADNTLIAKAIAVDSDREVYKVEFRMGERVSVEFIHCRYIDDSHPTENYLTGELRKALKEAKWKLEKEGGSSTSNRY